MERRNQWKTDFSGIAEGRIEFSVRPKFSERAADLLDLPDSFVLTGQGQIETDKLLQTGLELYRTNEPCPDQTRSV